MLAHGFLRLTWIAVPNGLPYLPVFLDGDSSTDIRWIKPEDVQVAVSLAVGVADDVITRR